MKRFSVFSLMVVLIAGCENGATNPELPPTVGVHSIQSLTSAVGAGLLLATTNDGELVEIDLDAGTAEPVGDAGLFEGRDLGWTGLSFDPLGNLFVSSRFRPEPTGDACTGFPGGRCAHLYNVDPETGAVLQEVGSTSIAFLSDIDFTSDGTLYGSFFINELAAADGGLATIDLSSAKATLVGRFESGSGTRDLENGGLSVHPQTGELWGVESNNSPEPSIFRINPVKGLALDVVRLGIRDPANPTDPPNPTPFGLDALEILPDGRFIGLRGKWENFSIALYEINPTSGELTDLDLWIDEGIQGRLNGLESPRLHPAAAVEATIAEIRGIVEGGLGTPMADKLEDVIATLEAAFAELTKTPPDNQAALGKIEGAVGDLEAAVNDGLLDPVDGAPLMDELAGIARQMAVNARNEAMARAGDPSAIADVQQYLADGDVLSASAAKDAVAKYKDALAKAEGA